MKGTHGRGAPPEREQGRWGTNALYLACLAATAAALLCLLAAGTAQRAAAQETTNGGAGRSGPGKIVGGQPVPDGRYPFMATLGSTKNGDTIFEQHGCGSTLIDLDSVLTAGHCVFGVKPQQMRVTVGITDLREENQGETRKVAAVFVHPRFDIQSGARYDAAVLKLASPVEGIEPVRVPAVASNGFERPGQRATIAGWGNTVKEPADRDAADGGRPPRMREAQVPVVSDAVAEKAYKEEGRFARYFPPLMVAAGKAGKATCRGDSGGPLFFRDGETTYQVGITSYGIGCGARGWPKVFTETNAGSTRSFVFQAAAR